MYKRILIIGGYGNFGSYITKNLCVENAVIIIAGRNEEKCKRLISSITNSTYPIEYQVMDISENFPIEIIKPDVVVHTSGPFQNQGYSVAEKCIDYGCHYIDLADGRSFVSAIGSLDLAAQVNKVTVLSGASSVPCLTSAVIEKYRADFSTVLEIDSAIATAQQTNRGVATTASILEYTGKPFNTIYQGKTKKIFGWQGLWFHSFPRFGWRALSYCDIPDLEIFPKLYPDLKTIRFSAGTELSFLHVGLWMLSWIVRIRLVSSLAPAAKIFVKVANMFDYIGSGNSAFYMKISGEDLNGRDLDKIVYILAHDGDGPYIPCAPAIILCKKLIKGQLLPVGASPCTGIITLEEYLAELNNLNIELIEE